ncbi:MAG: C45 family peptidase [Syntrophorhabdaceae bacterium]|nr:C45 family peptidase [Syntrophorhabdaceae bacterium]
MKRIFLFLFIFIIYASIKDVYACTVWGATGSKTGFNGTLIAKNRDNVPHLVTEIRFHSPPDGFKIFALFDIEEKGYIVAGINEKGLAVFNASAMSIPRHIRNVAKEDFTERLLKFYDSVDSVLKDMDVFTKSHPVLYMLGDKNSLVKVEVAPEGKVAVEKINDGVMAFTNHYTHSSLENENINYSKGSIIRLKRVQRLLNKVNRPFNMEDFISISNDKKYGPVNGIWRKGNKRNKIRTLACIIIAIPPSEEPEVYIKLANPGDKERVIKGKISFLQNTVVPE